MPGAGDSLQISSVNQSGDTGRDFSGGFGGNNTFNFSGGSVAFKKAGFPRIDENMILYGAIAIAAFYVMRKKRGG